MNAGHCPSKLTDSLLYKADGQFLAVVRSEDLDPRLPVYRSEPSHASTLEGFTVHRITV